MENIIIDKLSKEDLEAKGVFNWPVWEKEASRFSWYYDSKESCYIIEGRVRVEPVGCVPVEFGAGDFVVFPAGMDCVWYISEPVKKHYSFG